MVSRSTVNYQKSEHVKSIVLVATLIVFGLMPASAAQDQTLWSDQVLTAILNQSSGERVYQDTAKLATLARYPASKGFHRAAEYVAERAQQVGLRNVQIQALPANQPSWDVVSAQLWLVGPSQRKLADYDEIAVSVAMFSNKADLTAEVSDVGEGTSEVDYAGKDVKGKLVLASGQPEEVQQQAIVARGAAGIISYFANEFFGIRPPRQAVSWTGLSPELLTQNKGGFAFMISPQTGDELRQLLRRGERLKARAHIQVETSSPGQFEMVTAEITGTEPPAQDVVFTAHLDHQNPGANDNASGSAALIEIARVLNQLIDQDLLSPPRRTIRFWWVTEIRGTYQYFFHHPDEATRILANINIDQAGGNRHGRSDFVAILQPAWMGTFVDDIIKQLGDYAMTHLAEVYHAPSPLFVAPTGTRQPFNIRYWPYARLSDHIVFETAGIDIPSISLAAASLEFIHSSEDSIEHIDPTQLKRSVFLSAACGGLLATLKPSDLPRLLAVVRKGNQERIGQAESQAFALLAAGTKDTIYQNFRLAYYQIEQAHEHEARVLASLTRFHDPIDQVETGTLLAAESKFSWNLFAHQESSVALLADYYEHLCRQLGVTPQPLSPTEDEQRLSRLVPRRIVKLGPDFTTWLRYSSPQLGPELSQLIKNYIDGSRNLAEIYRAASVTNRSIQLSAVEQFVRSLAMNGWVEISSK
jgi:hypothetical protein